MRLLPDRSAPCHEDIMQREVAEYMANRRFAVGSSWNQTWVNPKVYREVSVRQIGRISDVVVVITDRKVVNIECKMSSYEEVYKQALDHLSWADYSYICLFADTYLPAYMLDKMINNGIGLLLWRKGIIVEALQSGYNKRKDKQIRQVVMEKLKKMDSIKTAESENLQQGQIW